MFYSWKFSKSTLFTLIFTGLVGIFVLAFAYHLRHYTEILSGVIGGLTIILGMVTAEWLRSTREQATATELGLYNLMTKFQLAIFNIAVIMDGSLSYENKGEYTLLMDVQYQLQILATKTRWPQPNAKVIREMAHDVGLKVGAMMRDAVENDHIWSTEKRYQLNTEFLSLLFLVFGHGKDQLYSDTQAQLKFRETEPRLGMTTPWRRQAEREKER